VPQRIISHQQLDVYKRAFEASMALFELSRAFPKEETYSLTSQLRRSSRSVAANLTEAWRKRRYPAAFISKLSDAETEAAETQTWIEYGVKCGYLDRADATPLYKEYDRIIATIVTMMIRSDDWLLPEIVPKQRASR
jgi:four helix bundle protein